MSNGSVEDTPECDILLFVATSTEEAELCSAAQRMKLSYAPKKSKKVGDYYDFGVIGASRVLAVRHEMGPLGHGGSASRGLLYVRATRATGIIQLGMAFGVNPGIQKAGDILVSTAIFPYDERDIHPNGDSYTVRYDKKDRCRRHPAKKSLINIFIAEKDRKTHSFGVHMGELLSGAARIFSGAFLSELINAVPGKQDGIVGGEMEAVGLLSVSNRTDPIWIVVKGISDFGYDHEQVIEKNRPVACRNAAEFVLSALSHTTP